MKKSLAMLLTVLMVISTVSCLFTMSASADAVGETQFTYTYEDASAGIIPFKEVAPASGEPAYPSGDKWGVVTAAGYGVWDSTLTTMNASVFDGNVYGADGTLIGTQTAQKRSDNNAGWNGNLTVVESAGNGYNGSNKYIKVARADLSYALGMDVEPGQKYELTYWVKTSGKGNGAKKYFSSGVFSSINMSSNTYGDRTATVIAQVPNMLFDAQQYPDTADKAIMGEFKRIAKADSANYTQWTKITHTFSTPAENVDKVYFVVSNGIEEDGVFLDDISLVKLPFEVDASKVKAEFYDSDNQIIVNSNAYGEAVASPYGTAVSLTAKYTETDAYEFIGWYKGGQLVSPDKTINGITPTEVENYSFRVKDKNLYNAASYENMALGSVKHESTATNFPTGALWGGIKTAGYRGQTFAGTVYDKNGNSYTQVASGSYSHSGTFEVTDADAYSGTKSLHLNGQAWSFATALENVTAGKEYKLSFKIKANHTSDAVRIQLKNAAVVTTLNYGNNTGDFSSLSDGHLANNFPTFGLAVKGATTISSTGWTTIDLDFTMPANLTALDTVYLVVDSSGVEANTVYDMYIDDISFSEKEVEVNADDVAIEFYNGKGLKIENSNAYGKVTVIPTGSTVSMTVDYSFTPAYSLIGWYKNGTFVSGEMTLTDINPGELSQYSVRIKDVNLYPAASYEGFALNHNLQHTSLTENYPVGGQWGGFAWAGYRKMTVAGTVYDNKGNTYTQTAGGTYSNGVSAKVTEADAHSGSKSLLLNGQYWTAVTALENIKPGKTYDFSYWIKKEASQTEATQIKSTAIVTTVNIGNEGVKELQKHISNEYATFGLTLDNGKTSYSNFDISSGDWVKVETRFTAPQNATELDKLYLIIDASGSETQNAYKFYVDDISLSEVFDGIETAYNGAAAIRTAESSSTGKNGLRIYNEIKNDFITENNIVEYGSVAIRTAKLGASELTVLNAHAKGMAYNSTTLTTPKLWDETDNSKIYTAYLTNISGDYYAEPYTVRAYAIDNEGNEYYGEEITFAVFDVVCAIDNGNGVSAQTEADKAAFKAFAGGDGYVKYDEWLKAGFTFAGKLRNEAKADDTLFGAELTKALEVDGYYEPLFERAIANEGNLALLKKVFEKANRGEDITLVGFGGSITQGAACATYVDSYSHLVKMWLQEKFPSITVNYFNAGIGSTTSVFGVGRMTKQVLDHNPDLVLLDFTTNDQSVDYFAGSYEAILRTLTEKDIAVVTITYGNVVNAEYQTGVYHRGANREDLHGPVMLYNDVPVIDYYGVMWDCYLDADGDGYNVAGDAAHWNVLWNDYIHPTVAGHKLSANAIIYYLDKVYNKLGSITDTKFIPATPLDKYTENFMGAQMFDIESSNTADVTITKSAGVTKGTYGNVDSTTIFHYNTWDITAGEYVEFTVSKAKFFALLRVQGRTAGTAKIYVNGGLAATDNAYSDSNDLNWMNFIKFYDGSDTVKIKIEGSSGTYRVTKGLLAYGE